MVIDASLRHTSNLRRRNDRGVVTPVIDFAFLSCMIRLFFRFVIDESWSRSVRVVVRLVK
jgi:hypothetical protein